MIQFLAWSSLIVGLLIAIVFVGTFVWGLWREEQAKRLDVIDGKYADTYVAPSPLLIAAATWEESRAAITAEIAALKARIRAIRTPTQAMFVQALETAGETVPDTFGPKEWWTIGDRRHDQPAPVPPRRPTPQRPSGVYQPSLFDAVRGVNVGYEEIRS